MAAKKLSTKQLKNGLDAMLNLFGLSLAAREDSGRTIFSDGGVDVATVELRGESLIVEMEAPKNLEPFQRAMRHWKPVPGKTGWLRFERVATRDPRPNLDADLGAMIGAAIRDRKS